jgi:hypothetical protein
LINSVNGILAASAQQCHACSLGEYILDSNNSNYSCQLCPAGAYCDGASLKGKIAGSLWVPNYASGIYSLQQCPLGYKMNIAAQDCTACAKTQYILNSSSPYFDCQDCPVGAVCDGSSLIGLVAGSLWMPDFEKGIWILKRCPPGFEMFNHDPSSFEKDVLQINQECRLCPATYFCLGEKNSRSSCPEDTFSAPGANSSSACMAAIFVVVSVVLPLKQNEFTSYKHQLFAAAVAYSAATPLDRVLIQRIVQVRRSIGNSVQIISEIAVLEEKELKRILERVNTDSLNKELADLGLPQGAVSSVSVKNAKPDVSTSQQASNTNLIIGLVFGALSFIVIVVVIASLALQKKLESKEEREHKLKASEIRSFFKIRKSDGYVLSSESVPFRLRRENVCFMHKTSLDAVVHLALFQDFEVGHIDSFCLCLVDSECDSDCKERYQLFC